MGNTIITRGNKFVTKGNKVATGCGGFSLHETFPYHDGSLEVESTTWTNEVYDTTFPIDPPPLYSVHTFGGANVPSVLAIASAAIYTGRVPSDVGFGSNKIVWPDGDDLSSTFDNWGDYQGVAKWLVTPTFVDPYSVKITLNRKNSAYQLANYTASPSNANLRIATSLTNNTGRILDLSLNFKLGTCSVTWWNQGGTPSSHTPATDMNIDGSYVIEFYKSGSTQEIRLNSEVLFSGISLVSTPRVRIGQAIQGSTNLELKWPWEVTDILIRGT